MNRWSKYRKLTAYAPDSKYPIARKYINQNIKTLNLNERLIVHSLKTVKGKKNHVCAWIKVGKNKFEPNSIGKLNLIKIKSTLM